jgi:hypothetical protein
MPVEIPEAEMAETMYNTYAEAKAWRFELGPMMNFQALNDSERVAWGKAAQAAKEYVATHP